MFVVLGQSSCPLREKQLFYFFPRPKDICRYFMFVLSSSSFFFFFLNDAVGHIFAEIEVLICSFHSWDIYCATNLLML